MDCQDIYKVCETIGSFNTSNGNFQLHVAFDLDGIDVMSMPVGDLVKAMNEASERYNRIHPSCRREDHLSEEDQGWCSRFVDWYEAKEKEDA